MIDTKWHEAVDDVTVECSTEFATSLKQICKNLLLRECLPIPKKIISFLKHIIFKSHSQRGKHLCSHSLLIYQQILREKKLFIPVEIKNSNTKLITKIINQMWMHWFHSSRFWTQYDNCQIAYETKKWSVPLFHK